MKMKKISIEKLKSLIDRKVSFILLDVVTPEFYNHKHIPTAVNACVYEIAFIENMKKLVIDPLLTIVVYATKKKSLAASIAAQRLVEAGYDDVMLFEGGLEEWEEAGYDIESEDIAIPPKPKLEDRKYVVDTFDSVIYWTARSVNSRHIGTLALNSGELIVENGKAVSGEFVVDMNSIKDTDLEDPKWNEILIKHLKSDDFFDVGKYPESSLKIKSIVPRKGVDEYSPHCKVLADMTIKGVTHEISFPALLEAAEGGALKARLHFDFDRIKWNVLYGSEKFFEGLGMHLVDEYIGIEAYIIAK
ncbi:MAG: sulfurtransferase [Candidatus Moranbacteria bacterium]|nr:sulfurtransferase [Candidatus Moranbacteria bacterium]